MFFPMLPKHVRKQITTCINWCGFSFKGTSLQQNMSNSAPWYSAITVTLRNRWIWGESSLKWYFKQVHLVFWNARGKIVCNKKSAELMISETGDDSSKNTTHKIQHNIGGSCAATSQSWGLQPFEWQMPVLSAENAAISFYRAGGFPCFPVFGCFCNYFLYIPTGCRSCDVHAPLPEYDDVEFFRKKSRCVTVDGLFLISMVIWASRGKGSGVTAGVGPLWGPWSRKRGAGGTRWEGLHSPEV